MPASRGPTISLAHASWGACLGVGLGLVLASACGGRSSSWTSCPSPPGRADIRHFKVQGGETCGHARRVLDYTAFGHEGGCGPCHYLSFTCEEHQGGLRRNSSGGSYYTYADDLCVQGDRRAAWTI